MLNKYDFSEVISDLKSWALMKDVPSLQRKLAEFLEKAGDYSGAAAFYKSLSSDASLSETEADRYYEQYEKMVQHDKDSPKNKNSKSSTRYDYTGYGHDYLLDDIIFVASKGDAKAQEILARVFEKGSDEVLAANWYTELSNNSNVPENIKKWASERADTLKYSREGSRVEPIKLTSADEKHADEVGELFLKAVYSNGSKQENALHDLKKKALGGDTLAQYFYLEANDMMHEKDPDYMTIWDGYLDSDKIKAATEMEYLLNKEPYNSCVLPDGTPFLECGAGLMWEAGPDMAQKAIQYYDKCIEDGLVYDSMHEDDILRKREEAKSLFKTGFPLDNNGAFSPYRCDVDDYYRLYEIAKFSTDDYNTLHYGDKQVLKDMFEALDKELDLDGCSIKERKAANNFVNTLANKGYPEAQSFMAYRFEKEGDYENAEKMYDKLAQNKNTLPIRAEWAVYKTQYMNKVQKGEWRPKVFEKGEKWSNDSRFESLDRYKRIDENIGQMRKRYAPTLAERIKESQIKTDRETQEIEANIAKWLSGVINGSAEFIKAGLKLTGAIFGAGVSVVNSANNTQELQNSGKLDKALKGIDKVSNAGVDIVNALFRQKKGGR